MNRRERLIPPSRWASSIPPPKNKQPLRSFEGHAGSGLDASMCVLLLHNSWLHAISTQMDMFPWPITSGLMHPSSCFILPSSAQLATAGIHQGFYVFFGLLNPKYRQKGETRSHTNTHTLRPDREVNYAVVILLWIIATSSSSDHHLPGVSVSSEMWQQMMCKKKRKKEKEFLEELTICKCEVKVVGVKSWCHFFASWQLHCRMSQVGVFLPFLFFKILSALPASTVSDYTARKQASVQLA